MPLASRVRAALRGFGAQGRRELDEELRFHLERQAEVHCSLGMPDRAAERLAGLEFGGWENVREETRDMGLIRYWNELVRNLRYAARGLRHAPGFTAVAILVLALGIGANTAIFSLVHALLLQPLPFRNPQQLVQLYETEDAPGNYPLTGPDYQDWKSQSRLFAGMTLYTYPSNATLTGHGEPQRVVEAAAEDNFFQLLGVEPALGRFFTAGDNADRAVTVLSYALWKQQFAGDPTIVGRKITINEHDLTVVGVAPASFHLQSGVQIWLPKDMHDLGMRGEHQYNGIGRLRPGVTLAAGREEIAAIAHRLAVKYENPGIGSSLFLLRDRMVRGPQRASIVTLAWIVGLVLLIACANLANLLLARALTRKKEISVRLALGASRGHILRQLLTEAVLLSLAGAAVGAGMAEVAVRAAAASPAFPLPRFNPIAVDGVVLAATAGLAIMCGVLFGLAPALQLSRTRLNTELSGAGAMAGADRRRRWLTDGLVVGEIALTLALVAAAALLLESYRGLRSNPLGIQTQNLLTARLSLPAARYPDGPKLAAAEDALLGSLRAMPGVQAAALSSELPLEGGRNGYISLPGSAGMAKALVEWTLMSPSYFATMGIPIVEGRAYTAADAQSWEQFLAMTSSMASDAPPMVGLQMNVVVNQTMARHFFAGREALGQHFRQGSHGPWMTIVGIAGDTAVEDLATGAMPQAYFPALDVVRNLYIEVRSPLPPGELTRALRATVASFDANVPVFGVRTMDQVADASVAAEAFEQGLVAGFAGLALLLAAAGLYGVMSYLVSARRREMGVRLALGASPASLVRLVLVRGVGLAGVGIVAGLLLALAAGRLLASQLYHVRGDNPAALGAAVGALLGATLIACYLPARRAARTDPNRVLRLG